jgi:hypothetical protein
VIVILFLAGLALSQGVAGRQQRVDHSDCYQSGLLYPNLYTGSIYVCPSDVSGDPKWDDRSATRVPIEVHQAVSKSREELRVFAPNEKRWRLREVTFVKVDNEHWVYRVDWTVPRGE